MVRLQNLPLSPPHSSISTSFFSSLSLLPPSPLSSLSSSSSPLPSASSPFSLLFSPLLSSPSFLPSLPLLSPPPSEGVLYGPLHNEAAVEKFENAIAEVKTQGGNIVYGGKVITLLIRGTSPVDSALAGNYFIMLYFSFCGVKACGWGLCERL